MWPDGDDVQRNPVGNPCQLAAIFQRQWQISLVALLKHGDVEVVRVIAVEERSEYHGLADFRFGRQAGGYFFFQEFFLRLAQRHCHVLASSQVIAL